MFRPFLNINDQTNRTPKDCTMAESIDAPISLEYRPDFGSLPHQLLDVSDNTTLAHQSFPFLPGYRHISFEEQRLEDMKPPPSMISVNGQFGMLNPSALSSLRAAYTGRKVSTSHDTDLLE